MMAILPVADESRASIGERLARLSQQRDERSASPAAPASSDPIAMLKEVERTRPRRSPVSGASFYDDPVAMLREFERTKLSSSRQSCPRDDHTLRDEITAFLAKKDVKKPIPSVSPVITKEYLDAFLKEWDDELNAAYAETEKINRATTVIVSNVAADATAEDLEQVLGCPRYIMWITFLTERNPVNRTQIAHVNFINREVAKVVMRRLEEQRGPLVDADVRVPVDTRFSRFGPSKTGARIFGLPLEFRLMVQD